MGETGAPPRTSDPENGTRERTGGTRPPARRPRTLREEALSAPNLLTMLRVALIPVVLWFLAEGTPRGSFLAAMIYAISAITDFVDGWLARRMNLISVLGKFLDPLADKLLVMASLVAMTAMGRVPSWAVIVILARELSITSLRVIAMSEGVTIAAGRAGKDKAALQMVAIFMLIVHHTYDVDLGLFQIRPSFHDVGLVLLYASVFFAITSAGEYVQLFAKAIEKKDGGEPPAG